jgi:tRNA G18 (ribose-2'-O)-methylase SpoU
VPAYVAPLRVLESIVGFEFHRGCVALGERGPELALDDLLAAAPRRLVLLEGVSNPDNVGGVLRVARALGADAAVLSPGCCDPLYRKAVRVSMGAALTLPFITVADWQRALVRVRAVGFTGSFTPAAIATSPRSHTTRPGEPRSSSARKARGCGPRHSPRPTRRCGSRWYRAWTR